MSPEAQRIAIAQGCGFTNIRQSESWELTDPPEDRIVLCGDGAAHVTAIPDYLNDLNAMHEAEKGLTADQARAYHNQLGRMAAGGAWMWHATAGQRAEAWLRANGLWVN